LVVHKKGNKVYLRDARMFHREKLQFRVGIPFGTPPHQAVKRVAVAYAKASTHLPPDLQTEDNFYERINNLYTEMNSLPGPLRAEVEDIMAQYGVQSDNPLVFVRAVRRLCG